MCCDDPIGEGLAEPVAEPAADRRSPRGRAGSAPKRCRRRAPTRPGGSASSPSRRRCPARAAQTPELRPVAAALLHDLEQVRLVAPLDDASRVALHARPARVRLDAAAPPAAAAQAAGPDDHVAELARRAAAVAQLAVEDQPAADTGADPHAEQVRGTSGAAPRVNAPSTPTLTSLPTDDRDSAELLRDERSELDALQKPGTLAASWTALPSSIFARRADARRPRARRRRRAIRARSPTIAAITSAAIAGLRRLASVRCPTTSWSRRTTVWIFVPPRSTPAVDASLVAGGGWPLLLTQSECVAWSAAMPPA